MRFIQTVSAWSMPIALMILGLVLSITGPAGALELDGVVIDGKNPVPGARVRVQGRPNFVVTDRKGRFHLSEPTHPQAARIVVTAGKQGWINAGVVVTHATTFTTIVMQKAPEGDDPDYEFITPHRALVDLRHDEERLAAMRASAHTTFREGCNVCHYNPGCALCHREIYNQWQESHHANAVRNPWVQNLYNGTDIHGNENVGPGFRLDYPDQAGECADCHAPTAALRAPGQTDLKVIHQRGVAYPPATWYKSYEQMEIERMAGTIDAEGVYCDFCHKIKNVIVNNKAGVNGSIEMGRIKIEEPGRDVDGRLPPMFVYGPFDDVISFSPVIESAVTSTMVTSYNPIFRTSEYCSACHQHTNEHGVMVQGTYQEWKQSSYPQANIQCQDCHMRSKEIGGHLVEGDADKFWTPPEDRDPATIRRHDFPGGHEVLVKNAATLSIETAIEPGALTVRVGVKNANAGHYFPSGVPIRNMLLLVTPVTAAGDTLEYAGNQRVPEYGGTGDPADGNYAGYPGKGFAVVYGDDRGNRHVMDWQATRIVEDTRLRPKQTDVSVYRFVLPSDPGRIDVETRLIYRRAYKPLADAKGWKQEDLLVQSDITSIVPRVQHREASRPPDDTARKVVTPAPDQVRGKLQPGSSDFKHRWK